MKLVRAPVKPNEFSGPARLTGARALLGKVIRSRTVMTSLWMGAGGAALAVANLLFAGSLDAYQFGQLSLLQALLSLGVGVGPLGFNHLAARRELSPTWSDLRLGALAAVVVGAALAFAATRIYDMSGLAAGLIFVGCAAGAFGLAAAGFDQGMLRLNHAQAVIQSTYLVFVAGALAFHFIDVDSWLPAGFILVAGYCVSALLGAAAFAHGPLRLPPGEFLRTRLSASEKWKQAFVLILIAASTHFLMALERLVIPRTLTMEALGTFAVAWTLVGSPLKLLHTGITFSVLPQLRGAASAREARRILWNETRLALALVGAGAVPLLVVGVPLIEYLYGGKYPVTYGLVSALIVAGSVGVFSGIAHAAVVGLAARPGLNAFQWAGWFTTGVAAVFAIGLSSFGLVGVVAGGAIGWALRIPLAWLIVRPLLYPDRDAASPANPVERH